MGQKVCIDVEARFVDNVSGQAGAASSAFKNIESAARAAMKAVDALGKKLAGTDATDDLKNDIDEADKTLSKFGRQKVTVRIKGSADGVKKAVDEGDKALAKFGKKVVPVKLKASSEAVKKAADEGNKILEKFDSTTAEATLDVQDKATAKVKKSSSTLKDFATRTYLAMVDASDRATAKIKKVEASLEEFGGETWQAILQAKDYATTAIKAVTGAVKAFAGKTYTGILKLRDSSALSTLSKMSSNMEKFTGKTWTAVVKIKDMATAPLTSIKNMLFSIKTLAAAIFAGFAANKLIAEPVSAADAYSSAKIGFSTLIGESGAQQMMNDLDAFAKKTPFSTTGVIDSARKMMAMGWDTDNLLGDLEVFGNAAAATGNLETGLESIVRAMSQIKTKGRLSTEELDENHKYWLGSRKYSCEETYGKTA